MALDTQRIVDAYKLTTYGDNLTPESEDGLKDLIDCIIDEIKTNGEVNVDFTIPPENAVTMEVQVTPVSFGVPAPVLQVGAGLGFGKGNIT